MYIIENVHIVGNIQLSEPLSSNKKSVESKNYTDDLLDIIVFKNTIPDKKYYKLQ